MLIAVAISALFLAPTWEGALFGLRTMRRNDGRDIAFRRDVAEKKKQQPCILTISTNKKKER
jgi:hypothetical protein